MMNEKHKIKEVKIDFNNYLWLIAEQWKAIALFSLVVAVVLAGVKYCADVKAYKSKIEAERFQIEQQKLPREERINSILKELPNSDVSTVEAVVAEKEWISNQKNHIRDSVLMKLDPANIRILRLGYKVTAEDPEIIAYLLQRYSTFASSESFINIIRPYVDEEANSEYIRELLVNDDIDDNYEITGNVACFYINIALPDDADVNLLKQTVDEGVDSYSRNLGQEVHHTISNISTEDIRKCHNELVKQRNCLYEDLLTLENTLRAREELLSEQQKMAVNSILAIKNEQDIEISSQSTENGEPSLDIKYLVIGLLIGIITYMALLALILVVGGRVYSIKEMEYYTDKRGLGEIYSQKERKGLRKLFWSKSISKLHYKNKLDVDAQVMKAVVSVNAICKMSGNNEITMLRMLEGDGEEATDNVTEKIYKALRKRGIQIREVIIRENADEAVVVEAGQSIILADNCIKASNLQNLVRLCNDYNVATIGCIYATSA